MFSAIQKDLLIEARKGIEEKTQKFICCAINTASLAFASEVPYEIRREASKELKEQIESGIEGYSSIEMWLFSEVGVYPEDLAEYARDVWNKYAFSGWSRSVTREEFDELCRQARLAWIDRALETGKLA
jgi:hypothetical protein